MRLHRFPFGPQRSDNLVSLRRGLTSIVFRPCVLGFFVLVPLLAGALLRESQQLLIRNQHTPSYAPYCQLLFCNERVQRSFADADEPSGFRFAVEQDVLVHACYLEDFLE
jgi:hypothetical protein